jgi:hypothetical protein
MNEEQLHPNQNQWKEGKQSANIVSLIESLG